MTSPSNRRSLGPIAIPGSYAAQVERALHALMPRLRAGGEDITAMQWVAGLIPEAQHFVLPDDGKLLDDNLDSVTGEPAHLPFPIVTLSYHSDHSDDWRDDAEPLDTYHPARRLTFATETSYAALCDAIGGRRMAEDNPLAHRRCIATKEARMLTTPPA